MMRELLYTLLLEKIPSEWIKTKDTDEIFRELVRRHEFADLDLTHGLVANALAWGRDNGKLTPRVAA
jgi:hypothetical protein